MNLSTCAAARVSYAAHDGDPQVQLHGPRCRREVLRGHEGGRPPAGAYRTVWRAAIKRATAHTAQQRRQYQQHPHAHPGLLQYCTIHTMVRSSCLCHRSRHFALMSCRIKFYLYTQSAFSRAVSSMIACATVEFHALCSRPLDRAYSLLQSWPLLVASQAYHA